MTLALLFGLLGAFAGHLFGGGRAAIVGGFVGAALGWWIARSGRSGSLTVPRYGPGAVRSGTLPGVPPPAKADTDPTLVGALERLDALDRRLERLERALQLGAPADATSPTPPVAVPQPTPTNDVAPSSASAGSVAAGYVPQGHPDADRAPASAMGTEAAPVARDAHPNPLWAWFTMGNTLTRIGALVLLFGVGFLLRWFAERFTVPIEWRLSGVALAGFALIAVGARVSAARPAYGRALEGAGGGVLYLTVFAAFRLYEVLPAGAAFALLVAISAILVWLALRADSQAFAALAIVGGFLAPVLVAPGGGEPIPLFTYLALLNGAVFVIAWRRAWRGLNALGFLFTFALALVWGFEYYAPRHFAAVEPFLLLFFSLYVAIAILEALRGGASLGSPVDSLLVFGVPLMAFALQIGLVRDMRHGAAWSAVALAAVYASLHLGLRRRLEEGAILLARSFLVLAVVFATVAIPFAVDARRTSAWWSLEAAGAFWLGCRQRQTGVRVLALLLQAAAAFAFVWAGFDGGERVPFANAYFVGALLIAIAAFATAATADRHSGVLGERERTLVPWVFAWGILWWVAAGYAEVADQAPGRYETHAVLGWVAGSTLVGLVVSRLLRWPRLALAGLLLLPAMLLAAADDLVHVRTTLRYGGFLVWPSAWVLHWSTLRALEARGQPSARPGKEDWPDTLHAMSAVLLVVWLAWECGEWAGRHSATGTVWITCATGLPAILYVVVVTRWADGGWPFAAHRQAYALSAGTVVATLLAAWFVAANVLSPGDPYPLPYVPLANPLDLTLALAMVVCVRWSRAHSHLSERRRYLLLGIALFIVLNGIVIRTAHHWADLPWRLASLLTYKPLQAALTLTWTATALPLMVWATRRRIRPLWMIGAALLALVVAKLFLLDLSALAGLPRVVAFLGVGLLLLVIGYLSPLPPAPEGGSSSG